MAVNFKDVNFSYQVFLLFKQVGSPLKCPNLIETEFTGVDDFLLLVPVLGVWQDRLRVMSHSEQTLQQRTDDTSYRRMTED